MGKDKSDLLENLTKVDSSDVKVPANRSNFEYRIRKIRGIVNSLTKTSGEYLPEKTVDSIKQYIESGDRIFYSELTNSIYGMSEEARGTFETNLERLLEYSSDRSNNVPLDVYNDIVRLWDHFNLARYQIDNVKSIVSSSMGDIRDSVYKQLFEKFKGIEKEYITILGIFASIVLAFIGGLVFSTSVLQYMKDVSIYRLVLIVVLIGFVLINTINILLRYIFKLNDRHYEKDLKTPILAINITLGILLVIVIIAWGLSAQNLPNLLSRWLPWC